MRQAEMEMNRASNMIVHEAEIMSRPQRTWIQTAQQKARSKGSNCRHNVILRFCLLTAAELSRRAHEGDAKALPSAQPLPLMEKKKSRAVISHPFNFVVFVVSRSSSRPRICYYCFFIVTISHIYSCFFLPFFLRLSCLVSA